MLYGWGQTLMVVNHTTDGAHPSVRLLPGAARAGVVGLLGTGPHFHADARCRVVRAYAGTYP